MYEKERQDGVPCRNTDCEYWSNAFEQNCGSEYENGGPAVETCEAYDPKKMCKALEKAILSGVKSMKEAPSVAIMDYVNDMRTGGWVGCEGCPKNCFKEDPESETLE